MRRTSPHPSLSGASSTSIDYGSGGLHRSQHQAAARFSNETVVLDSTIPLPSHPDPDIFDVIPTAATATNSRASPVSYNSAGGSPPSSSGSRLVYTPPMSRTANYYSSLPTHSRGNRSPSKSHVRGASLANSSSFSSPSTVGSSTLVNPPSGRTSPVVVMPTAETLARTISAPAAAVMNDAANHSHTNGGGDRSPTIGGSPNLKPLVVPPTPTSPSLFLLAYPTSYQSTTTSTTAHPTTASDPLLHAQSESHPSFASTIVAFFRSLLIYLCCFMSPSTYDALERARIEAAIAANNPLSPYSVYSKSSSARRHHAKERLHRHRHSTMIAAASRTASVDANANPTLASNLLHMHHPSSTTLATSPLGVTIVGVTTSRDSDSDSDDERETTDTFKSSCDQACCDSSCCRTVCCNGWIRCCTPRRSVCVLTYLIFLCGALFAAYYWFIFRKDGWKFPVRL